MNHLTDLTPDQLAAAPGAALAAAVERAEAEILRALSAAACNAGSTLVAALLLDDMLHVANVGDCRAVLVRGAEAIQITTDHKPGEEGEAARIARHHAAAAGSSELDRCSSKLPGASSPSPASSDGQSASNTASSPVVTSDGYLYGELAVARGLGSQHLKRDPTKRAFTHVPDIFSVQLVREDDMLLLASDGLWDTVDNSEAVAAARRCMAREKDASAVARALVDRAVRCKSADNVSVVAVCLHDRGIALPKTNSMLFRRMQLSGDARPGGAGGSGCLDGAGAGGLLARGGSGCLDGAGSGCVSGCVSGGATPAGGNGSPSVSRSETPSRKGGDSSP